MLKIDFASIRGVGKRPTGLIVTLVVNWLAKPFSMALLGWLFFKDLFLPLIVSGSLTPRRLVAGPTAPRRSQRAAIPSSDRMEFGAGGGALRGCCMLVATSLGLFVLTAVCELVGCYLPYLWLRRGQAAWLLFPAALSLTVFAWLLTLHPFAAGRTYAAYGGVYVVVAVLWLWLVDGVSPDRWDLIGATVTLGGMAIIAFAPRG